MGRMKDYFEFSQLLHWLSEDALQIMLDMESEEYRTLIIKREIEARHVNPAPGTPSARTTRTDSGNSGKA